MFLYDSFFFFLYIYLFIYLWVSGGCGVKCGLSLIDRDALAEMFNSQTEKREGRYINSYSRRKQGKGGGGGGRTESSRAWLDFDINNW